MPGREPIACATLLLQRRMSHVWSLQALRRARSAMSCERPAPAVTQASESAAGPHVSAPSNQSPFNRIHQSEPAGFIAGRTDTQGQLCRLVRWRCDVAGHDQMLKTEAANHIFYPHGPSIRLLCRHSPVAHHSITLHTPAHTPHRRHAPDMFETSSVVPTTPLT
jgi:hypothetical protein